MKNFAKFSGRPQSQCSVRPGIYLLALSTKGSSIDRSIAFPSLHLLSFLCSKPTQKPSRPATFSHPRTHPFPAEKYSTDPVRAPTLCSIIYPTADAHPTHNATNLQKNPTQPAPLHSMHATCPSRAWPTHRDGAARSAHRLATTLRATRSTHPLLSLTLWSTSHGPTGQREYLDRSVPIATGSLIACGLRIFFRL